MSKSPFYVSLQSNVCEDLFPQNKIGDFKNRLGSLISLPSGEWEVALTDLSYTAGIAYVQSGELLFTIREDASANSVRKDEIVSNSVATTSAELAELLNSSFGGGKTFNIGKTTAYTLPTKLKNKHVFASDKIRDLLGLKTNNLTCSTQAKVEGDVCQGRGVYPVFLAAGNTKLFVYCNLIRTQYIGNTRAPCLRVVNYSGDVREQKHHEFIHPHFMELAVSEFDTIHIYILNEVGEVVPFLFGNLTVTLRFRQKKE